MMKVYADAGNWVTINGVHVLIGGNGKIVKGPAKFIGSTVADMKNVGKSASDRKEELKKRLSEKSGASSKKSSKETKKSDANYKEKFSGKSSKEIQESIGSKSMSDSDIKARIKALDKELIDKNPRDGTTTAEWRDLYSEQKALMNELSSRGYSPTSLIGSANTTTKSTPTTPTGKYPSGIDTPAQKRAYTRAINSGMSSSEAKASALGKATSNAQKYKGSFDKATTTSTMSQFYTKSGSSTMNKPTIRKTSSGKYNADNIPQVSGASKRVMRKTADYMNRGLSYDDAFDRALQDAGYGLGGSRGWFR